MKAKKTTYKTIIASALLTLILVAGILEGCHVKSTFSQFDTHAEELQSVIEKKDLTASLEKVEYLENWWEKKRSGLELFVYAPDLRTMSISIAEIKGSLFAADFENAASKTESLFAISKSLKNLLDFNFTDIL